MKIILLSALLFVSILSGCIEEDKQTLLGSGEYAPFSNPLPEPGLNQDVRLYLNLDSNIVVFIDDGGDEQTIAIIRTDDSEWISGCHTMSGSNNQEIAYLDMDSIKLGEKEIFDPVIVADCGNRDTIRIQQDEFSEGVEFILVDNKVSP
ncbi:MAG: hypothetical protein JXR91_15200 [Deltaproteobacteria bacterium]|nr:hypothetical protein [Deltaproteobacteria bacterium]